MFWYSWATNIENRYCLFVCEILGRFKFDRRKMLSGHINELNGEERQRTNGYRLRIFVIEWNFSFSPKPSEVGASGPILFH